MCYILNMNRIDKIVKKINDRAEIGIVLGSGFGNALPEITNVHEIEYHNLGIKYNKVEGHTRKFVFGDFNGKRVLIFNRLHFYESGNLDNLRLLYKIICKLGVKTLLMSTAAGAVNKNLNPADLVLVTDHINLTGQNPLIGNNPVKFLDLKNLYDKELLNIAEKIGESKGIKLNRGIHCQLTGPTYETPSEVKMLRLLGVDTVSMSPVLDAIEAYSLGIKILLIAGVTNKACDIENDSINHKEVLENAGAMSKNLKTLFEEIMLKL